MTVRGKHMGGGDTIRQGVDLKMQHFTCHVHIYIVLVNVDDREHVSMNLLDHTHLTQRITQLQTVTKHKSINNCLFNLENPLS
jgi:hypothetical protein